jgi:IPT/TIG domain
MAVPTVTSVTPSTGSYLGGTTVLIAGTGFTGTTTVAFGGVAADFELSSATLLAATSPAHLAGAAQVVVTNADGPGTEAVNFTYTVPSGAPITYSDALTTDMDKVRFHIGDKVVNAGPQPLDANFSDQELNGLLAIEGTWQRATAAAFETLAALWAKHVNFGADGMSASLSNVAEQYRASAKEWRQKYGGGETSGSQAVIRADGYSQDIDNVEVDYL